MNVVHAFPMSVRSDDWKTRCCTDALTQMSNSGIPFLIGGSSALRRYTFMERRAKDLDVYVMPADVRAVLTFFHGLGYRTELPFPHWLGKVFVRGLLMDVIFSSGNGVARVDKAWFEHAVSDELCGVRVRLCPPRDDLVERSWSAGGQGGRPRARDLGDSLDWPRLIELRSQWRVLFSHRSCSGSYPSKRHLIPDG